MNQVNLTGRLVKDPTVSKTTNMTIAKFNIAIDRGGDKGTDYPNITCFGKTAELVEKYLGKGRLVAICGRLQTGSYEKDGHKVYTTDVIADRVEFLDKGGDAPKETKAKEEPLTGFSLDDAIPF